LRGRRTHLRDFDIRFGEIVAHEKERRPKRFRGSIGEAIAEVQFCGMADEAAISTRGFEGDSM
jgi:hypothetical protein